MCLDHVPTQNVLLFVSNAAPHTYRSCSFCPCCALDRQCFLPIEANVQHTVVNGASEQIRGRDITRQ